MVARTTTLRWAVPAAILALAITLQLIASIRTIAPATTPSLGATIPSELPGWTARELPLGETEELKNQVIGTLQFDEYVSRLYTRGPVTVTIYAAYWRPNKVPPRSVGVHTPDTCWIQNGWKRTDRAHAVSLSGAQGRKFKPAEFGTYYFGDNKQHVYFWHLVGGRPYSYDQEGLHSLLAPLQDLATFGLTQRREQLFVRLAANVPFDRVWEEPGFELLLAALGQVGITDPPEAGF